MLESPGGDPRHSRGSKSQDAEPQDSASNDLDSVDYLNETLEHALRFAFGATSPSTSPSDAVSPFRLPDGIRSDSALDSQRYQIREELGRGGVGAVFSARDNSLRRELAVKVLLDKHLGNGHLRARFVEEAQISGQLQHPGIVPIHELGRLDDGRLFFSMKLVHGRTLSELLKERPNVATDRQQFLGVFARVSQTIAYAHARGIIHRDLKPENIMVGDYGEVHVVDWGLAKVIRKTSAKQLPSESDVETEWTESPSDLSVPGTVMGTPSYMSPEQARGQVDQLDERADVFGLGGILCQIIAGRAPFEGETASEVRDLAARGQIEDAIAQIKSCGADREVRDLACRCLEVRPDDRPNNAREVTREIESFLASLEERARNAELKAAEARGRALEERRARRLTLIAAVLGALLLLGGAAYLVHREHTRTQAEATVAAAIERAAALLETGQAQRSRADLERGRDVINHAASIYAQTPVSLELRTRSESLSDRFDVELHRQQVLERLEQIREAHGDRTDWETSEPGYAAALQELGINIDTPDVNDCIARITQTGIPQGIAQGLDDLSRFRRRNPDRSAGEWKQLLRIAHAVDPDPWRQRVRTAILDESSADLVDLAKIHRSEMDSPWAAVVLGAALIDSGEFGWARSVFESAALRFPRDFWVAHGCAVAVRLDGDGLESLPYYKMAASIRPESPHAWCDLASHYLHQRNDEAQARAHFERALSVAPKHAVAQLEIARSWRRSGDNEKALVAYRKATRGHKGAIAWSEIAEIYRAQGDAAAQEAAVRSALLAGPRNAESLRAVAKLRSEQGRWEQATTALEQAMVEFPNSPILWSELGDVQTRQGKTEAALTSFRHALEYNPDYVDAHVGIGAIHLLNDELLKAELSTRRATRLAPTHAVAWYQLAMALHAQNKQGWIPAARRALDLHLVRPLPRRNIYRRCHSTGMHFFQSGDIALAVQTLELALRTQPQELDVSQAQVRTALYFLGASYFLSADYPRAIETHQRLLGFAAEDGILAMAKLQVGQAYLAQGEFEKASTWLADSLELTRSHQPDQIEFVTEALEECQAVLELGTAEAPDPDLAARRPDPKASLAVARWYRARADYETAVAAYQSYFEKLDSTVVDVLVTARRSELATAALLALPDLTTDQQQRYRNIALASLNRVVDFWHEGMNTVESTASANYDPATAALQRFQRRAMVYQWGVDSDLSSVREASELEKLDADQHSAWLAFWGRAVSIGRP